jgi:hypothetical protein
MSNNPWPPPPQYAPPPPQQGYPPAMPTAEDESQLNILAICHFVYAGLLALVALMGLLYVAFGVFFVAASAGAGSTGGGPPPAAIGVIVAAFGGFFMLLVGTKAGFVAYSGMSLRRRTRRNLSFVVACLCCINIPLGALLGVFTIVVLSRPSVKALYARVAYYGA